MSFRFKKSLGQNFLRDLNTLERISKELNIKEDDNILEIGPGDGAITQFLLKAKNITVVEKDSSLVKILEKKFSSYDNLKIIEGDFLEQDLKSFAKIKVIGSIPYYITGPIIKKLIEESEAEELFLIIQKEVAKRLVAIPSTKDYGILTLLVKYYGEVSLLFNISKNSFYPVPNVESSMIKITLNKPGKYNIEEEKFNKCVKLLFGARRKTILNNLSNILDKAKSLELLNKIGIDPNLRAEDLDIEKIIKIAEVFFE